MAFSGGSNAVMGATATADSNRSEGDTGAGMSFTEEEYRAILRNQEAAQAAIGQRAAIVQKRRVNKYHVAPKAERTVGLLTFASKAEAQAYQKLLMLQSAGQIKKLELQPIFQFPMKFSYIADFRVTHADGCVEVIDVKGMETPVFRLKAKCMAYFYPDVKLKLWKRGQERIA